MSIYLYILFWCIQVTLYNFFRAQQTDSYTTKKLQLKQPWKYSNISETGFQVSQLAGFCVSFSKYNTTKVGHVPNNARMCKLNHYYINQLCKLFKNIYIYIGQMLLSKTMMKYLLAWPICQVKNVQMLHFDYVNKYIYIWYNVQWLIIHNKIRNIWSPQWY